MKLEFRHTFSSEEAVARVRALTDYWRKYGITADWQGQNARVKGKVKGVSFEGTFAITASALSADVKVGFLAEKLGGKAYVERKLTEYLDPKNPLAELQTRT